MILEILQILSGSSSFGRASAFQAEGSEFEPRLPLHLPLNCFYKGKNSLKDFSKSRCSSEVEYFLGKEGVTGSIPVIGSTFTKLNLVY